ncbi:MULTISPECIES: tyrosine-type recombinase/integrase [unclassified Caballeronia]|uniref:tyrosine-type recombinase/integrase n=1 Tax=unclassified Caballeronia TaxID=2646786 RepID=UPI00285B0094|nr:MULTISPECIES: tyrosine-type recombinase/integrase [unclassified Caballeronia]MDR5770194.1 tyrosine-type recombinase/integrase [Caballeronia sp. LZ002]MDR5803449.1 tyrosine-type recombinase/integrase [Caballeronia sp. LZ001]MDR5845631.1 tyrosine-type recombinase/integrase [Caballeronia sp. LZ003]
MPRATRPLNDSQIRALKPRATRYCLADGNGLILEVMPTGRKVWRFRYSLHGNRQPLVTIGEYGKISLKAARIKAQHYAAIVASGVSPVSTARQDRGAEKRIDTLKDCAELYLAAEIDGKSADYRRTTRRTLEKDIYPAIGSMRIGDVSAADVLAICDKIKGRGSPKMALHTRNVLKRLYEYAIARQLASVNPASMIPARFVATTESRTRVLAPNEIGTMLRAIYASDIRRPLKLALHLLTLTMVRKSELIEATWDEFDLNEAVWRIPAARMKKDREHWVYLPHQAVVMLTELSQTRTSRTFVFPTVRGPDRPIAKSTLNQAVKALGLEVEHFVLHDLRRTASTHLHEMGQSSDAIEKALAHSIRGMKGVYNRAEYGTERQRILQLWADFVDAQIDEGQGVLIGRFKRAS